MWTVTPVLGRGTSAAEHKHRTGVIVGHRTIAWRGESSIYYVLVWEVISLTNFRVNKDASRESFQNISEGHAYLLLLKTKAITWR